MLFGYGLSGSYGGVIFNSHGEQILGKSPTEPEGVIEKISINCSLTGTQSSTGRGVAVRNFEAEARQMIYMPIEQMEMKISLSQQELRMYMGSSNTFIELGRSMLQILG